MFPPWKRLPCKKKNWKGSATTARYGIWQVSISDSLLKRHVEPHGLHHGCSATCLTVPSKIATRRVPLHGAFLPKSLKECFCCFDRSLNAHNKTGILLDFDITTEKIYSCRMASPLLGGALHWLRTTPTPFPYCWDSSSGIARDRHKIMLSPCSSTSLRCRIDVSAWKQQLQQLSRDWRWVGVLVRWWGGSRGVVLRENVLLFLRDFLEGEGRGGYELWNKFYREDMRMISTGVACFALGPSSMLHYVG